MLAYCCSARFYPLSISMFFKFVGISGVTNQLCLLRPDYMLLSKLFFSSSRRYVHGRISTCFLTRSLPNGSRSTECFSWQSTRCSDNVHLSHYYQDRFDSEFRFDWTCFFFHWEHEIYVTNCISQQRWQPSATTCLHSRFCYSMQLFMKLNNFILSC